MITRICPSCKHTFKKCRLLGKIRTCASCATELYYDGEDTILLSVRAAAVKAADSIVGVLEAHISKRDGLNFKFEGAGRVRELKLAYDLIDRAEAYLSRQIDIGVSAVEFCIEIIEKVLNDSFWAGVVQSIAMFMKHVSTFAKEVFLEHKTSIERRSRDVELLSLADFSSYERGSECYQVAST